MLLFIRRSKSDVKCSAFGMTLKEIKERKGVEYHFSLCKVHFYPNFRGNYSHRQGSKAKVRLKYLNFTLFSMQPELAIEMVLDPF